VPRSLPSGLDARLYLEELGLTDDATHLRFFADLDAALEWTEEETIRAVSDQVASHADLSLGQFELFDGLAPELVQLFEANVEPREFLAGEKIFHKGDQGRELYLIRSGEVKIVLPLAHEQVFHLATFDRGGFFGDMAFLDNETRSADALALGTVSLFVLRREAFDKVAEQDPRAASVFFEALSSVISRRLRLSHRTLAALQQE